MKNVRGVVMRQAAEGDRQLVSSCFDAMKTEVEERKFTEQNGAAISQLEGKLKNMADTASSNAKKVLGRMNEQSGLGVQTYVFQAWAKFHEDYQKNKDYEDAVKAAEKKLA